MKIEAPLTVRRVPVHDLDPGPPRHTEEQIATLRAKVRRLGIFRPVLGRGDGRIGAGRGLWEAAVAEGLSTVPVIDIPGLSDAEWEALASFEDKSAEAGVWRGAGMALQPSGLGGVASEPMGFHGAEIAPLVSRIEKAPGA